MKCVDGMEKAKKNIRGKILSKKAGRIWFCLLSVMTVTGIPVIKAEAVPAMLAEDGASIYEQAAEDSANIGNLIRDNTFEYLGDVTAEDGSVWHAVTTSNGINGYLRGSVKIAAVEEPAAETIPEEAANEEDANETELEEEAPVREDTPQPTDEEEAEEETEEGEEEATVPVISQINNNREKTYYSRGAEERIKKTGYELEDQDSEEKEAIDTDKDVSIFRRMDKSLIFSVLILTISVITGVFFYGRFKKDAEESDIESDAAVQRKPGKKSRNRRIEKKRLRIRKKKKRKKGRKKKTYGKI